MSGFDLQAQISAAKASEDFFVPTAWEIAAHLVTGTRS